MFLQIIISMCHYSEMFYDWCLLYWLDFGIIGSVLVAALVGVLQVFSAESRTLVNPDAGIFTPHDALLVGVLIFGLLFTWALPLILLTVFWSTLLVVPISIGYIPAKIYKSKKDKVNLPKAKIV